MSASDTVTFELISLFSSLSIVNERRRSCFASSSVRLDAFNCSANCSSLYGAFISASFASTSSVVAVRFILAARCSTISSSISSRTTLRRSESASSADGCCPSSWPNCAVYIRSMSARSMAWPFTVATTSSPCVRLHPPTRRSAIGSRPATVPRTTPQPFPVPACFAKPMPALLLISLYPDSSPVPITVLFSSILLPPSASFCQLPGLAATGAGAVAAEGDATGADDAAGVAGNGFAGGGAAGGGGGGVRPAAINAPSIIR